MVENINNFNLWSSVSLDENENREVGLSAEITSLS